MPALRPMREEDVAAVHRIAVRCFDDLADRLGLPRDPPHDPAVAHLRHRHLVGTDPDGCWVAEHDGALLGAAIAIRREGMWGLSLLVVDPVAQSDGLGSALLRQASAYGHGARARMILSSQDPRALRAYTRLGLTPQPCLSAVGTPRGVVAPAEVREGTRADIPLTEAVDRHVRGAARGMDIACCFDMGLRLLVLPDRGYAVLRRTGDPWLLAATDDEAARAVLRAVLAEAAGEVTVEWLAERQRWALGVCVDAGLELRVGAGVVFTEGEIGPFRPYLPSGAFL